jgi:hypothetical protein
MMIIYRVISIPGISFVPPAALTEKIHYLILIFYYDKDLFEKIV